MVFFGRSQFLLKVSLGYISKQSFYYNPKEKSSVEEMGTRDAE